MSEIEMGTRVDVVREIAARFDVSADRAERSLDAVCGAITDVLRRRKTLNLEPFASFQVRMTAGEEVGIAVMAMSQLRRAAEAHRKTLTPASVLLSKAASFVGLTFEDLVTDARTKSVVPLRWVVWSLAYYHNPEGQRFSWPELAEAALKKSHSGLLTPEPVMREVRNTISWKRLVGEWHAYMDGGPRASDVLYDVQVTIRNIKEQQGKERGNDNGA